MLIQSLKQHFPARFPEWMMAGMLSSWGAYVVLHPELFTDPRSASIFAGMVWGLVALLIGMVRAFALFARWVDRHEKRCAA